MSSAPAPWLPRILRAATIASPWILSLLALYLLEYRGVWEVDRPFRGVISLLFLGLGMSLSFTLASVFPRAARRRGRRP